MTMLETALSYHDRGWSIFPIKSKGVPCVRWSRYQTQPPQESTIRKWFANGNDGIAAIFGAASGDLGCRDFDEPNAYSNWANKYPALAELLPTSKTPSEDGYHVYFQTEPAQIAAIRIALEKPDGIGAIKCGDGELRIGVGSYSVLPPTTGYSWLIPPVEQIPELNPAESGLICPQPPERPRTLPIAVTGSMIENPELAITMAILRTTPTKTRTRHGLLFEFARELHALFGGNVDVEELKPFVKQWFNMAKPYIQTRSWSVNWRDFREGFPKVKFPKGAGVMAQIYSAAVQRDPPEIAHQYAGGDDDHAIWLTQLCRGLHEHHQGQFNLDCRTAGRLLGVSHVTASSLLRVLCEDGVLRLKCKGRFSSKPGRGQSSVYQYLGD